ncbi:MAG: hypothetical protein AB1505_34660 [Candidatus Latescibacterota bacterium]
METTLDVRGLPVERVAYLKSLIQHWRRQAQPQAPLEGEDDVRPTDFIIKSSRIIGGEMTRAMAYDRD